MPRLTSALRIAAERLLRCEVSASKRGAQTLSAASHVNEKFRQVLSTLLGVAGFQALLARALTLAKAESPELSAVEVQPDGVLAGLRVQGAHGARRFNDGEVILVAHLLGLLVTFVGAVLMLRLVNDTWPKLRFDDLDFDQEENR